MSVGTDSVLKPAKWTLEEVQALALARWVLDHKDKISVCFSLLKPLSETKHSPGSLLMKQTAVFRLDSSG